MSSDELEKTKIYSSFHWLLHKSFQGNIPIIYTPIAIEDNHGEYHLRPALTKSLASAELYVFACSNIFPNEKTNWTDHSSILHELESHDFTVKDKNNRPLAWHRLQTTTPFHTEEHVNVIGSIMAYFVQSVVDPDSVVRAISRILGWAPEANSPIILNPKLSLQVWLNVVCACVLQHLRIHDAMAHFDNLHKLLSASSTKSTVHEVTQLLELIAGDDFLMNLSLGNRLALLIHFYSPTLAPAEHFQFHFDSTGHLDLPSTLHNSYVVWEFTQTHVPTRPWHFDWPIPPNSSGGVGGGGGVTNSHDQVELLSHFSRHCLFQSKELNNVPSALSSLWLTLLAEMFQSFEVDASSDFQPSTVRYLTYGISSSDPLNNPTTVPDINFAGARRLDTQQQDNKGTYRLTPSTSRQSLGTNAVVIIPSPIYDDSNSPSADDDNVSVSSRLLRKKTFTQSSASPISPTIVGDGTTSLSSPLIKEPLIPARLRPSKERINADKPLSKAEESGEKDEFQPRRGVNVMITPMTVTMADMSAKRKKDKGSSSSTTNDSTEAAELVNRGTVSSLREQFLRQKQQQQQQQQQTMAVTTSDGSALAGGTISSRTTWASKSNRREEPSNSDVVSEDSKHSREDAITWTSPQLTELKLKLEQKKQAIEGERQRTMERAILEREKTTQRAFYEVNQRHQTSTPKELFGSNISGHESEPYYIKHRERAASSTSIRRPSASSKTFSRNSSSNEEEEDDDEKERHRDYQRRKSKQNPRRGNKSGGGTATEGGIASAQEFYSQITNNLTALQSEISRLNQQQQEMLAANRSNRSGGDGGGGGVTGGGLNAAQVMGIPPYIMMAPHQPYYQSQGPTPAFAQYVSPYSQQAIYQSAGAPHPPVPQTSYYMTHPSAPMVALPSEDALHRVGVSMPSLPHDDDSVAPLPITAPPPLPPPTPPTSQKNSPREEQRVEITKENKYEAEVKPTIEREWQDSTKIERVNWDVESTREEDVAAKVPVSKPAAFFIDLDGFGGGGGQTKPLAPSRQPVKPKKPLPSARGANNESKGIFPSSISMDSIRASQAPSAGRTVTSAHMKVEQPFFIDMSSSTNNKSQTGRKAGPPVQAQAIKSVSNNKKGALSFEVPVDKSEELSANEIESRRQKMLLQRERRERERQQKVMMIDVVKEKERQEKQQEIMQKEDKKTIDKMRRDAIFQAYQYRKAVKEAEEKHLPIPRIPASLLDNPYAPDLSEFQRHSSSSSGSAAVNKGRRPIGSSNPVAAVKRNSSFEKRVNAPPGDLLRSRGGTVSGGTTPRGREIPKSYSAHSSRANSRASSPVGAPVAEYHGPRLYVKPKSKSNVSVITNALSHCCLAGVVNEPTKNHALQVLSTAEGSHFMILLRGGCQYRGVYSFDPDEDLLHRLVGTGPRLINQSMVQKFFKYNSGAKKFSEILSTKHLSAVVDAIMIHNVHWKGSAVKIQQPSASK